MNIVQRFILDVRLRKSPFHATLYRTVKRVQGFRLPYIMPLGAALYYLRAAWISSWNTLKSKLYCEQIMRFRCKVGKHLTLDGDAPHVHGYGKVTLGDHVKVGNRNTWIVGLKVYDAPTLTIGNHTTIGYLVLFSVAQSVVVGDHCLFAGEIKVFDNNSHSLDWRQRRAGAALTPDEVQPVRIEDDVWVGTNCLILKGVTIGRGSVIAAGSVVTKDVPPFSLAGGNPAHVIRSLESFRDS
jgi:acetyltransferase-like isoleucine patch superfamily enzyme